MKFFKELELAKSQSVRSQTFQEGDYLIQIFWDKSNQMIMFGQRKTEKESSNEISN